MKRSAIREETFKLLYSLEIQKTENVEEQIQLYLECNEINDEKAIEYITEVITGIEKNLKEIEFPLENAPTITVQKVREAFPGYSEKKLIQAL